MQESLKNQLRECCKKFNFECLVRKEGLFLSSLLFYKPINHKRNAHNLSNHFGS